MSDCLRLDNLSSSDQKYLTSSNIRIFIFATLNFCRCMLHVPGYQYYNGRVACDLCVTRKYCVTSNPRRQSTPVQIFLEYGPPAGALHVLRYMSYELNFEM
jgi:hypothetical protein